MKFNPLAFVLGVICAWAWLSIARADTPRFLKPGERLFGLRPSQVHAVERVCYKGLSFLRITFPEKGFVLIVNEKDDLAVICK